MEITAPKITLEVEPEFYGAGSMCCILLKSDTTALQVPMLLHAPKYACEIKIKDNFEAVKTQSSSINETESRLDLLNQLMEMKRATGTDLLK